jgi:hypothetical protein
MNNVNNTNDNMQNINNASNIINTKIIDYNKESLILHKKKQ